MVPGIEIRETHSIDEVLAELSRVDDLVERGYIFRAALKKALTPIAKAAKAGIRKPGYKGDLDQSRFPPLSKVVGVKVKEYSSRAGGNTWYGVIAADYKKGGYHAHLVEFGHRLVRGSKVIGQVGGKPFLGPAVAAQAQLQERYLVTEITKAVDKALGV